MEKLFLSVVAQVWLVGSLQFSVNGPWWMGATMFLFALILQLAAATKSCDS